MLSLCSTASRCTLATSLSSSASASARSSAWRRASAQRLFSARWRAIAQASARPSKVEVPRPISSISTRLCARRVVQDGRALGHLHHEGRAPAGEVVGRADAREDPVDRPERARFAGTKQPQYASSAISATWRM